MTIFVHTQKINDDQYQVHWAFRDFTAGSVTVSFSQQHTEDRKICAEVLALTQVLERFPRSAADIVTSHGAMKKALKDRSRRGGTEICFLRICHPELSFVSSKHTLRHIERVKTLPKVQQTHLQMSWQSLGRPVIPTPIGDIEVTEHAFFRLRERFKPTANLKWIAREVSKRGLQRVRDYRASLPFLKDKKRVRDYSLYRLTGTDIQFLLADHGQVKRLTTCY